MKKCFVIGILLLLSGQLAAQSSHTRDSMLQLLAGAKNDSNRVALYLSLGELFEDNEPETAKYYYRRAGDLSKQLHYTKGTIRYITYYVFVLNHQGLFDSSLALNLQAVTLSRQLGDSLLLAKALINTGVVYDAKGAYENAVQYYEDGRHILNRVGHEDLEAKVNDILQLHFFNVRQYQRGIDYGEKAVPGARKTADSGLLGRALNNLGLNYLSAGSVGKAEASFNEALCIGTRLGDRNLELNEYLNLGDVYVQQDAYEKVKLVMEKALTLALQMDYYEKQLVAKKGLAYYYHYNGNYALAEKFAKESLALSYAYDFRTLRVQVLTCLSNLSYSMQNKKAGALYEHQAALLDDSLLNETVQENTIDTEKKYETAEKELRIKQLETEKKLQTLSLERKNTLNALLLSGVIAAVVISLLFYRTYRQRQKLQQQRINELEIQQQLTATEAILKGEAQERARLAKDLHDGLGGMLSGIKFAFSKIRGNLVMTAENNEAFERSLDMLDGSIKEMRRVAHNMMPEALMQYGLDTALRDYTSEINKAGMLQVLYQSMNMENKTIDSTVSVIIYRIVQELLNNIVKHAGAGKVLVQLVLQDKLLLVTVEDDGKGLDRQQIENAPGIGWKNIRSRVEFLKGSIDIQSAAGKGLSVNMEFNVS